MEYQEMMNLLDKSDDKFYRGFKKFTAKSFRKSYKLAL